MLFVVDISIANCFYIRNIHRYNQNLTMSYHNRLTKIVTKKSQLAKEESVLENERKNMIRKYDLRRKIVCGATFLNKIYVDQDPDVIRIFLEELKKASVRTQDEFPEFFGKENSILGDKVQLAKSKNQIS